MAYSKDKIISGIYLIRQLSTGRAYVGGSTHILHRWNDHRCKLNSGSHENPRLQQAWNETGASDFEFSIVAEMPGDALIAAETELIETFGSYAPDKGFNIYPPDMKVLPPLSEEHKRRLSQSLSGREFSPQHRHNLSVASLGHPKAASAVAAMKRARVGSGIGVHNNNAVLSEELVIQIKRTLAAGRPASNVAIEYQISEGAVRHILHGRHWGHILPDLDVYSEWQTHRAHR